ncbi:hypothetical protein M422DRAFT_783293 [Sphaerobolus stellatus SS14]|uniref:Unplaced genomic scaffold SPHSTscaffold_144, whole genome shotgun sequence n=1 Tax=Sphaerobolus stellatus (strain SS14) TaxID=990650 RepID=A0A0C9V658_SPHS4|nr:hypothetical protein M422DRAFT_783293 [Sphaerobolus stellatus SS14]
MSSRESPKVIFEMTLAEVRGKVLDMSDVTPCRLRFIDCRAFIDDHILQIVEVTDLRAEAFSAISYVWKGNPPPSPSLDRKSDAGSFAVKGAEDGDMISIDVLRCACIASLLSDEEDEVDEENGRQLSPTRFPNPRLRKARYIWLDRVCIMQTSKQDKNWQITQMFELYRRCTQCLVLPGGIQRLVPLDEETLWIHRAWTLQEALAPGSALALFAWKWGAGEISNPGGDRGINLQIVVPKLCAVSQLGALITACICGKLTFKRVISGQKHPPVQKGKHGWIVPVKILGAKTPNLVSLNAALNSTAETRERGIWQSVFGRTSSRPVDMVFSIMGLFGVLLDPSGFDVNDRTGATIALAQAILRKGGSASWIGLATRAAPFPEISTFPEFPKTSVGGKAMLLRSFDEPVEAISMLDDDTWLPMEYESSIGSRESEEQNEVQIIRGEMDDDGYLTFMHKASAVIPVATDKRQSTNTAGYAQTTDGQLWEFLDAVDIHSIEYPKTAAIILGMYVRLYEDVEDDDSEESDSDVGSDFDPSELVKFMLITEHAPDKFHVVSYFVMHDTDNMWTRRTKNWREYTFSVGGPVIRTISKVSNGL